MAVSPPIEPMLARVAEEVPRDGDFLFEPKWDGFRAIVFRGDNDVYIQSRDLRPLDRYFPDLHGVFLDQLPSGVVVDGEIVMPTKHGLDFGGLQTRLHPAASRVEEFAPLRNTALRDHPWREWAGAAAESSRMPGGQSRWSAGKDLSWEPLRIERVCEVKYDHMEGDRFRHATVFQRWRPDKRPQDCRYNQLDVTTPYELEKVFGA